MKTLSIILTAIVVYIIIVYLCISLINERESRRQADEVIAAHEAYEAMQDAYAQELESRLEVKYQKVVTITAYVPENPTTATMIKPIPGWHCAVSRALYKEWGVGGTFYAWGYGVHKILDVMPDIYGDEYRIDLMVGTVEEAKQIGVSTIQACLIER